MLGTYKDRIVGEVTECRCTRCGRVLDISHFNKFLYKQKNVIVYRWNCKDCISAINREHRKTKYGSRTVGQCTEATCMTCLKTKPVMEFTKFRRWGGEVYSSTCNECKANHVKRPKLTNTTYCHECINFSTLRRTCKIGLFRTPQPCPERDKYEHINMNVKSNSF